MDSTKEITALLQLIDDPDEDIYNTVTDKIISFGKGILPNLESLWEHTSDEAIQVRIETIIHKLHFRDLTNDLLEWKKDRPDLSKGAILIAKYHYPDLLDSTVFHELEKLRRNIWLEMNHYLTPLEQINIISSIFFNYNKQKGVELAFDNPDDYLINKALELKKGNAISNGIIYLIIGELLDIPVKAISIPRQFILAYTDMQYEILNPLGPPSEKNKFYIDPLNGQIYTHKDVENYFKRISVPPTANYFREMSNVRIIQFLLEELAKCFDNDLNRYKMNELLFLSNLLGE